MLEMCDGNISDRHFMDFVNGSADIIKAVDTDQTDIVDNNNIEKTVLNTPEKTLHQSIGGLIKEVLVPVSPMAETHTEMFRHKYKHCKELKMEPNSLAMDSYGVQSSDVNEVNVDSDQHVSDPYEFRSTPDSRSTETPMKLDENMDVQNQRILDKCEFYSALISHSTERNIEPGRVMSYPYAFQSPTSTAASGEKCRVSSDPETFSAADPNSAVMRAQVGPGAHSTMYTASESQDTFEHMWGMNPDSSHCQYQSFHPQIQNDPSAATSQLNQKQTTYDRTSTPMFARYSHHAFPAASAVFESSVPSAVYQCPSYVHESHGDMSHDLRARVIASSVAPKLHYTPEQRRVLGEEFIRSPKCPRDRKSRLARRLGLLPDAVTKYFRVARTKLRRQLGKESYSMTAATSASPVKLLNYLPLTSSPRHTHPTATPASPVQPFSYHPPVSPRQPDSIASPIGTSFGSALLGIHPQLASHLERVISPLHRRSSSVSAVGMPSSPPRPSGLTSDVEMVETAKLQDENSCSQEQSVQFQRALPSSPCVWPNTDNRHDQRKPANPKRHDTESRSQWMNVAAYEANYTPPLVIEPTVDHRPMSALSSHPTSVDLAAASPRTVVTPDTPPLPQCAASYAHPAQTTSPTSTPAQSTAPYFQAYDKNLFIPAQSAENSSSLVASAHSSTLPPTSNSDMSRSYAQVKDTIPSSWFQYHMLNHRPPLIERIPSNNAAAMFAQYPGWGWQAQNLAHAQKIAHAYWWYAHAQQVSSAPPVTDTCNAAADEWRETGL